MSSDTFTQTAQNRPTRITAFVGGATATGKALSNYQRGAPPFEDNLLQQPAAEIPQIDLCWSPVLC